MNKYKVIVKAYISPSTFNEFQLGEYTNEKDARKDAISRKKSFPKNEVKLQEFTMTKEVEITL